MRPAVHADDHLAVALLGELHEAHAHAGGVVEVDFDVVPRPSPSAASVERRREGSGEDDESAMPRSSVLLERKRFGMPTFPFRFPAAVLPRAPLSPGADRDVTGSFHFPIRSPWGEPPGSGTRWTAASRHVPRVGQAASPTLREELVTIRHTPARFSRLRSWHEHEDGEGAKADHGGHSMGPRESDRGAARPPARRRSPLRDHRPAARRSEGRTSSALPTHPAARRRGPVTLRGRDLERLRTELGSRPRLAEAGPRRRSRLGTKTSRCSSGGCIRRIDRLQVGRIARARRG